MSPNLFLIARKAVMPWTWCSIAPKSNNTRKLYFSQQPAPGIYAITSKQQRYLVALRPNGKKDVENLFRDLNSKEDVRLKSMGSGVGMNEAPPTTSDEYTENTVELSFVEKGPPSIEQTFVCQHDSSRSRTSSASSIISASSSGSTTFNDSCNQGSSPLGQESRNTSSSSLPSQGKISITSTSRAVQTVNNIMKNDGALPHQNSPFGRKSMNESSHSLSSFRFQKHNYVIEGIEKVDLNGYKILRRPLRIEYSQITKRWMFSSEIRARTIVIPMCRDLNCTAEDMSLCGKTLDRELFGLDDGESWVVVGRGGQHLRIGRKENLGENGRLYCVDEKTDCIRRQTIEEVKASRVRLAKEKGRFLMADEDASYMPVVRYLQVKR